MYICANVRYFKIEIKFINVQIYHSLKYLPERQPYTYAIFNYEHSFNLKIHKRFLYIIFIYIIYFYKYIHTHTHISAEKKIINLTKYFQLIIIFLIEIYLSI